ncbi:hypothetical protein SKAU_G00229390 [Synaphobranchus kaupii]|uniref:Uncharacterized protein n=1 Tax=Synaphobranchus kaupii TaxID=118154 RepID=A0A9Q1F5H2_SYNKA|nr:hypothetical protein SKAU_G00229390 [Synaphobranchus kaupii]
MKAGRILQFEMFRAAETSLPGGAKKRNRWGKMGELGWNIWNQSIASEGGTQHDLHKLEPRVRIPFLSAKANHNQ